MSNQNTVPPRLPQAPVDYNQQFMSQVLQILNLYFQQLNNNGPLQGNSLNLSSIDQTSGAQTVVLPTQTSLANLRVGDVYYDTSNANVLKINI
jgi:hypothetical protein